MWFNGFLVVIDRALDTLGDADLARQREAIVWGALREDVWCVPGVDAVVQNPSLSHFQRRGARGGYLPWLTPSAAARTGRCADRALAAHARGDDAAAFVALGRASHLLIDMACPVHAQGRAHGADPYEWAVEGLAAELRALPVPPIAACGSFGEVTARMAAIAQAEATGRVSGAIARDQARRLVPLAAAHAAQLFAHFAARARSYRPLPSMPVALSGALGMSPRAEQRWLTQLRAFAAAHGGARHYAELLRVLAARQAESGVPS